MKVQFTETVLRDANQSLIATRLPYSEFDGILETMDKAGYYSLECWGGATFDSCLRYLDEDPWERLRKIRAKCPNTKLQMLLRGQNLLGYHHYPDDVVRMFVKKSIENGIDIIRIFDALNDVRNIEVAVDETLKNGAIASGAICYTQSPIHNLESYIKLAKQMEELGCQTICIKDMAGILGPKEAYDMVKALKENVKTPIILHTHCTTGLGMLTLQKAVEAGCDVIDTAISSFSGGTSQAPTETMALIRLLINHPDVEIKFINSSSNAGNKITDVHEGLYGETDLVFTDELPLDSERHHRNTQNHAEYTEQSAADNHGKVAAIVF